MKKTLLSIAFAAFALCGFAQTTTTYTDDLTVTVDGVSNDPQKTDITVTTNENGTYTLSLKNFTLVAKDPETGELDEAPVGNIEVTDIQGTEENGIITFNINRSINIQEGDLEGVDYWLGPNLGDVPIELSAKMNNEKLFCIIDIDFALLGQIIHVNFGADEFNTIPNEGSTKIYTDDLTVTVDGVSNDPQKTDITVTTNENGTYTLSLKNFTLVAKDPETGELDEAPVGNIEVTDIQGTEENGIITFNINRSINIQEGDLEGVDYWLGPNLGDVPIELSAKMNNEKLFCIIDIDFALLGQIIHVNFGADEFNTTPDEGGNGIENVTTANAMVNVYNLQGVVVKTNVNTANALDGLKQGVYIVNGKKVVK